MALGQQCIGGAYRRFTRNRRSQSTAGAKRRYAFGLILALSGLLLSSCGAARKVRIQGNEKATSLSVNKQAHKTTTPPKPTAPPTKITNKDRALAYIETFAPVAQQEMKIYKIPASITLAQGLLESAIGQGRLALEANNHFGIKCHKEWNGGRIYHDDDALGECFRVYEDAKESYRDHSLFLKTRSRYAFLFDLKSTNYKAWAKGLKKAGYATDPKYPDKLIDLIERYQLDRFDTPPKGRAQRLALDEEEDIQPKRVVSEVHRVEKGDTLYSISKKYKVSVDQLIQHNQLKAPTIYPGQELSIPKTP